MTIIRLYLNTKIKYPNTLVNAKEECFQGLTHYGIKIMRVTQLTLHFGKLHVKHPVLIVDKIANEFIFGNDLLTQYKCDLLNSA